jgi:hypothetical protein
MPCILGLSSAGRFRALEESPEGCYAFLEEGVVECYNITSCFFLVAVERRWIPVVEGAGDRLRFSLRAPGRLACPAD